MTRISKNYDPRNMHTYLNAGRVERAKAVLAMFKSVKQTFGKLIATSNPGQISRPGTPNPC